MLEFDANRLWKSLPDLESKVLETSRAVIRNVKVGSQYTVSGALAKAASSAGVDPQGAGAFGLVTGLPFSLRLSRERLLIVSDDEGALASGWHEDGYAVTEMSGAFAVFEIAGQGAVDIVKRATATSPSDLGPCSAINFAGVTACVYRFAAEDTIRLHVDRGLAPYLWEWFETFDSVTAFKLA